MAVLRNRYHERVWFLGRHAADPDETIDVPDELVEERDADGKLIAGLDPDDMFWERIDAPGPSRAEFDAAPESAPDAPAPETAVPARPTETVTPPAPESAPDAPAPDEATKPE